MLLNENLFTTVSFKVFKAIGVLIDEDLPGINRRQKDFIPHVDEKRIEARVDGHGQKGSIDQSPPGEPHAHVTDATDNVGIGEVRPNCFDRLQSDEGCVGFNRYRKDKDIKIDVVGGEVGLKQIFVKPFRNM